MNDNDFLTSVETLRSIITDDDVRVVDCRFSLEEPDAGLQQYHEGIFPGPYSRISTRTWPRPSNAAQGDTRYRTLLNLRCDLENSEFRGKHVSSPTIRQVERWRPDSGGCCAGWVTKTFRCSMVA